MESSTKHKKCKIWKVLQSTKSAKYAKVLQSTKSAKYAKVLQSAKCPKFYKVQNAKNSTKCKVQKVLQSAKKLHKICKKFYKICKNVVSKRICTRKKCIGNKTIFYLYMQTNKTIEVFLEEVGLRTAKAVGKFLLQENVYGSNLLSDISSVEYTKKNLGRTDLQPLEGLEPFVDDIYIFGYLRGEELLREKGKPMCANSKRIVQQISHACRIAFSVDFLSIAILQSMYLEKKNSTSTIRRTIREIEETSNLRESFVEENKEEPEGIFLAKVDVSDIPIDTVLRNLQKMDKHIRPCMFGLYSIDYTQDFSGTLDRKTLVRFLEKEKNFRTQGDFFSAMDGANGEPTILDNTDSVGGNCCTWVSSNTNLGTAIRAKIYNKIVCNFEAGEVLSAVGGHLAEYVSCPNKHLQKTFEHPDVEARGCTRIELSVYNPKTSKKQAIEAIDSIRETISGDLFVVQPPTQQWKLLAKKIDKNLVVSNRELGEIFVAWYGHSETGRICGVQVHPKNIRNSDRKWKKSVDYAISAFGFRSCPIYHIEILATEPHILLAPLRCYTKEANTKTILARSKHPMQVHPFARDPTLVLPTGKHIEWMWREKKTKAIGVEKIPFPFVEIETDSKISLLSKKQRCNRQQDICDLQFEKNWQEERMEERKKYVAEIEEQNRKSQKDFDRAEKRAKKMYRYREEEKNTEIVVCDLLHSTTHKNTKRTLDLEKQNIGILGFRKVDGDLSRIVAVDSTGNNICIRQTKALGRILERFENLYTRRQTNKKRRPVFVAKDCKNLLFLAIQPRKTFQAQDGQNIQYTPIEVCKVPLETIKKSKILEIQNNADSIEREYLEAIASSCKMVQTKNPKTKPTRTIDMEEGEYQFSTYTNTTYRNKDRILLHLVPKDSPLEEPKLVHGQFLQLEVERVQQENADIFRNAIVPIDCRLGEVRRNPQRKKDRKVYISM